MSDTMLHGVLCMPPELWSGDEVDKMQRYRRYLQASRRIEELEKQLAERDAALARCVEALQPFSHADLCEELGGNMQGEASPVFSRNKAILTIGDFRKAATAAASIPTSAKAAAARARGDSQWMIRMSGGRKLEGEG